MKAKTLLAAGIVRDLEFRSSMVFELYIYALSHKNVVFKILDKFTRDDGSVIVRIVQQYNNAELIRL